MEPLFSDVYFFSTFPRCWETVSRVVLFCGLSPTISPAGIVAVKLAEEATHSLCGLSTVQRLWALLVSEG